MLIKDLKWKPENDSTSIAKTDGAKFTVKFSQGKPVTIIEQDGVFISAVMDISEYKVMDIGDAIDFVEMVSNKQEKLADKENKIIQILAEEINGGGLGYRILAYSELRPIAKRIIKETQKNANN